MNGGAKETAGGNTRARVLISGRVQAVGFRYGTRREAGRLGLSGWVRNLPDGRVEALFEGNPDAVEEMLRWCEHGPPGARVEDVSVERGQTAGEPAEGFEVR
jgi:acylphosphatase